MIRSALLAALMLLISVATLRAELTVVDVCRLYTDRNYDGRELTLRGGEAFLHTMRRLDKQISSINATGTCRVVVYDQPEFRGGPNA